MNEVIEKSIEMLKQAELQKGVLVANLKSLVEELEDNKTRECFNADVAKDKGDKDKYLQHFWQGVAYGLCVKRVENVLKMSGVE